MQSRILHSERNRPDALKTASRTPPELLAKLQATFAELMRNPMPADELAGRVLAGVERDDFYILSHADHAPEAQARAERVAAAAQAAQQAA